MNIEIMGRDELSYAPPFVQMVNPTDIQEVGIRMYERIRAKHSWDWINPTVYAKTGMFPQERGNILQEFLQLYVDAARTWNTSITPGNKAQFKQFIASRGTFKGEYLDEYLDTFMELRTAGKVPDSVYKPYTYVETSIMEDTAKAVGSKVGLYVAGTLILGIAVYGLATRGLPRMVTG